MLNAMAAERVYNITNGAIGRLAARPKYTFAAVSLSRARRAILRIFAGEYGLAMGESLVVK